MLRSLADARVEALAAAVDDAWTKRLVSTAPAIAMGRYALDRALGRGSYGVVFAGFDQTLEREVAVKVLYTGASADALWEARLLARVRHPNVVQVLDVVRFAGFDCLVMELVEGVSLRDARAQLEPHERIDVVIQAARGLAAVHRAKVVHGDVTPNNVLVSHDGRAALVDFGQSRLSGRPEPAARGTPGYLAPECCAGAPVDELSDQFSLCVTASRLLRWAGPAPLWQAIRRGLSASPGDRFADMDDLVLALEAAVAGRGS